MADREPTPDHRDRDDTAMTPELAVILTAHNRAELVEHMLAALAEQQWDGDWEIALVDNDSTDDTLAVLERWADKMPVPTQVMTCSEHHNLSYSRRVGVEATTARGLAFLDDDDVIGRGYVAAIATALRTHDLAGPRHEHALLNNETAARYRGSFQTTELGHIFGAPMVSGGGFSCTRTIWDALDGQSIATGYGGEDAEFCLRAARHGTTAIFVPDAVYHVRLRAGGRSSFRQGRIFAASRVRLYRDFGAEFGERPLSTGRLVRSWFGMIRRVPWLLQQGTRDLWLWQLGRRVGHLQGSVRDRVWYP